MDSKMSVKIIPEGVIYENTGEKRLIVLLLVPFYSFYERYETRRAGCPLGLEMVAAELVAKGFNVIFIDACMAGYNQLTPQADGTVRYGLTDEQLRKVLYQFNPDVVGVTSLFSNQAGNVARVAEIVREVYPHAIIAEGGGHASGDVDGVLKNPNVDMVVRQEGLITFPKLCHSIEKGLSKRNSTSILGVSYKDKNGKTIHNPNRPFIQNLDILAPRQLTIPLHKMYDTQEHTGGSRGMQLGRHAYIMTSLGCPGHCRFCMSDLMSGSKTRFFSLERVEENVRRLAEARVTESIVEDDQLLADIPRAMKIMDIFKKYSMIWFEEGGVSMFKLMKPGHGLTYKSIIDKMAETGCYRFYLAIESANPRSLGESHKPIINAQMDDAVEIVRYIASKGIQAVGGFMIGFKSNGYEESFDDMRRTVEYAQRLKKAGLAYVMLFIYTALPGTAVYPALKPFVRGYTSHERAGFTIGGLSPEQLTELRLEWMKEINGDSMDMAIASRNWGI